jgi:hypothetical protein
MMATIASAAMVALVFSVSFASSNAISSDSSEKIASSICSKVNAAFHIDADSYEQKFSLLRDSSGEGISIKMTRSSIQVVEGKRSVMGVFSSAVVLMDSNDSVESMTVLPGMEISIRACRATFEKENTVTIELIRH